MILENPTIRQLYNRIIADIDNEFRTQNIPHTAHKKLATALASMVYGLYNYAEAASKQISPLYADDEYLDNWFLLFNLKQQQATKAKGLIYCQSVTGITIPADSLFTNSDGFKYKTIEAKTLIAETVEAIAVEALETGNYYNIYSETNLMADNIGGIDATASNITGGRGTETVAELRARLIEKIRCSRCNGTALDFEIWAKEVDGVGKAFCNPFVDKAGCIDVHIASSNILNAIVTAKIIQDTKTKLEQYKPITAKGVNVYALQPATIDLVIKTSSEVSADDKFKIKMELAKKIYNDYGYNKNPKVEGLQSVVDPEIYRISIQKTNKGDFSVIGKITWIVDNDG